MWTDAGLGGMRPPAQRRLEPPKLEGAGRTLSWRLWRELGSAPPAVVLRCLDVGLLVSRAGEGCILGTLTPPLVVTYQDCSRTRMQ